MGLKIPLGRCFEMSSKLKITLESQFFLKFKPESFLSVPGVLPTLCPPSLLPAFSRGLLLICHLLLILFKLQQFVIIINSRHIFNSTNRLEERSTLICTPLLSGGDLSPPISPAQKKKMRKGDKGC